MLASMDNSFNNDIVASRPALSIQAIIDLKGSEFMASKGLELGLIDNIVLSLDAALALYFSPDNLTRGASMTLEEMKAKLETAEASIATMSAEHKTAMASAVSAAIAGEQARCLGILGASATLRLDAEMAVEHITESFSADMSLKVMTAVASATTKALATSSASGLAPTLQLQTGVAEDRKETLASAYAAATGNKVKA
jgi:hypothetical protein